MKARFLAALTLVSVALVACSSSDAPGDAGADSSVPTATFDANVTCATTADCAVGLVCAFAVADGCGAVGQCIYGDCPEDPSCPPVPTTPACGCNGTDVAYVTSAFTQAPVANGAPCGGVDAAAPDSAAPDTGAGDASDANAGDAHAARD